MMVTMGSEAPVVLVSGLKKPMVPARAIVNNLADRDVHLGVSHENSCSLLSKTLVLDNRHESEPMTNFWQNIEQSTSHDFAKTS
jgi:hypothetical protein